MELIAILFGVFLGGSVVETNHYQACKADGFEAKVCEAELARCLKFSKDPCYK
jgi:hypothetical protein